jgi:large subunit ribosomal protein L4e
MKILDTSANEKGDINLPNQFNQEIRVDLVKRSVDTIRCNKRQPYGTKIGAGMRASGKVSKRRNSYRTSYGHGISRVPRKILSRSGTRMNWVGAIAPGTIGGRKAHPPKSSKVFKKSMNTKEKKMALRVALSASLNSELVKKRGHIIPDNFPFIIDNDFENIKKTKDIKQSLENLGFSDELKRTNIRKIKAGIGKLRGRKYKMKKGPLIVVSKTCKLLKSANNIPGINIVTINKVNCENLAPGASVGRLTLYTKDAIGKINEDKLFI